MEEMGKLLEIARTLFHVSWSTQPVRMGLLCKPEANLNILSAVINN